MPVPVVLAVAERTTVMDADTLCAASAGMVAGVVVSVKHGVVVHVNPLVVPRTIVGVGSLPEPWFSIQKNCVCEPPAVIVHEIVFVNGLVVP